MHVLKQQKGFTLIEMLAVLFIVSVLLILTIPNISRHFQSVDDKGCSAYSQMLQSQVQVYRMNEKQYPTSLQDLATKGYVKGDEATTFTCNDGRPIQYSPANGQVGIGELAAS